MPHLGGRESRNQIWILRAFGSETGQLPIPIFLEATRLAHVTGSDSKLCRTREGEWKRRVNRQQVAEAEIYSGLEEGRYLC